MSESVRNRSAAIRHYLLNTDVPRDPAAVRRYAAIAARWEALRLLIDSGDATPADDGRYRELTALLRAATVAVGLKMSADDDMGTEGVSGITDANGFLVGDPERITGASWRDAAKGW